jgi:tRNA pseudouridine38-40 synthase
MAQPPRRVALLLEYDGSAYSGSQLQANAPSVQAALERAIEDLTGTFSRAAFAGRTDTGVHALGQIACFHTEATYSCEAFVGALNARLSQAIVVRAARDVPLAFDPRRDAISRRYRYCVLLSSVRSPLYLGRAWQIGADLDVAQMELAAQCLLGEHDFAAFAAPEAARARTCRRMHAFQIRRCGRMLLLEAEANAFLMHQMRRTVAALVDVGSGRLSQDAFRRHLREAAPGSYERTAPACGLYLVSVRYDPPLFPSERELC